MEPGEQPDVIRFPNGRTALVASVRDSHELSDVLIEMELQPSASAILLIGGADGLKCASLERLRPLFAEILAPLAQELGSIVVDGGTDSGVMRLMGQARTAIKGKFPLVGVAVRDLVTLSKSTAPPTHDALIRLEPHHTHFVLVPGCRWGDESPMLVDTARHLAIGGTPVVVLVNGGDVAWEDISESVAAGLPVIVIGGTGRVADQLAAAIAGDDSDPRAVKLANSGFLQSLNLSDCAEKLPVVIKKALSR